MISKNPNQAKRILFELCQQTEDVLFGSTEDTFDAFFSLAMENQKKRRRQWTNRFFRTSLTEQRKLLKLLNLLPMDWLTA